MAEASQPLEDVVVVEPLAAPPQYAKVTFNSKSMFLDVAYKKATEAILSGKGNWGRTNATLLNAATFDFQLACADCNKTFSYANPSNFWSTHSRTCQPTKKPFGAGASLLHAIHTRCHFRIE